MNDSSPSPDATIARPSPIAYFARSMADVPLLRSSVIPWPFEHGFTTRQGGVSLAPYDSLNLGAKWGDDPKAVAENFRRLLESIGIGRLHSSRQVHGACVLSIEDPLPEPEALADTPGDALSTGQKAVALAVRIADCVPIVMVDPKAGACAVVHAGWRGTLAGVAQAAVSQLCERHGSRPQDLRVAMGPSIGPCCFEVGLEVAERFPRTVWHGQGHEARNPRIDLRAANRGVLTELGIPPDQVDSSPPCTHCDPGRFFSFRRDGKATGQHLAFVIRRV